jgi:hypothetical protein
LLKMWYREAPAEPRSCKLLIQKGPAGALPSPDDDPHNFFRVFQMNKAEIGHTTTEIRTEAPHPRLNP